MIDEKGFTTEHDYSVEEVAFAVKRQKLGGAVGQDGISAVLLRSAEDLLIP